MSIKFPNISKRKFPLQGHRMHIVLVGNAPHVIRLPVVWARGNTDLFRRTALRLQESHLKSALKKITAVMERRKEKGLLIYFLDTLPVYVNAAGSRELTNGVMHPLSPKNQ